MDAREAHFSADAGPPRAECWRLRSRTLVCGEIPWVMGILNVTPDSFSDGGRFLATDRAVEHALQLASDGADLIDIGGESTRPFAEPVPPQAQLDRVLPVIEAVSRRVDVPLTIDTRSAQVAREAVAAGAEAINDVSGMAGDPAMLETLVATNAGACAMHMRGTPETMQVDPRYDDVVGDIFAYLAQRRDALVAAGVDRARICLDPGIGFGKTHQHNLDLMRHCWRFHALDQPLLVGHSRKGFLGKILGSGDADRTAATVGAAVALAEQGVQAIRVHDVRPVREALLAWRACRPRRGRH
jgi:dihydropteroate synthase